MNWKTSILSQSGLKCDKPGCTYRDDTVTPDQYEQCVGRQCPLCGSNLLTLKDFRLGQRLERVVFWYNVVMLPVHVVRTVCSRSYRNRRYHVTTKVIMDGTGSVVCKFVGSDGSTT